jgi:predicted ATPase
VIRTLAIENYRSLRSIVLELGELTVITGANGSGKSSVYRALRLLASVARNGAAAALAAEGGMPSVLSATPRSKGVVSLHLGFASDDFGYAVDLGLPQKVMPTLFELDPELKAEAVWSGQFLKPANTLVDRHGPSVRIRDEHGGWQQHELQIRPFDSVLSELADPRLTPELLALRDRMRAWRFYDHLRTDSAAPARMPQAGSRTPVLAADGADLAAALQTIEEIGRGVGPAVSRAFPGARVEVVNRDGWFEVTMRQPGLMRPLAAAELSDGTLRYLLLVAALMSPRPAEFLVLNEPETSLHPELIEPLAGLIREAAKSSQIVVVTHSQPLVDALGDPIELVKIDGETSISGKGLVDGPPWRWPTR